MSDVAMIGVDWGSTSLRAFAIARGGAIREIRDVPDGGVFASHGDFAARLTALLGDWAKRFADLPIVMCGMIGSDRGWVPAPYVPAPVGLEELAHHLVAVPFGSRTLRILPGVSFVDGDTCEVMRGEETIVMGLSLRAGTICLPGTHSKWVDIEDRRIRRFRTYMSGELRSQVLSQGALAVDGEQEQSANALAAGVVAAVSGVGNALFQARTRRLLGALRAEHVAAFVTGVLIGDELRHEANGARPVTLVAHGPLAWAYDTAMTHEGLARQMAHPEQAAAMGLWRIAEAAGLV